MGKLNDILQNKSQKLKASSYARNILVIHTDEPELRRDFYDYEIENNKHWFQKSSTY